MRAWDEDTGIFVFFFHSTWPDTVCFWEFHPTSVILGIFVFFESLASMSFIPSLSGISLHSIQTESPKCYYTCSVFILYNHSTDLCLTRKFSASAIDIHNIMNVAVVNSVFEDSYTVNISSKYRGNAGGLSLRYSDMNATNVIALVSNCHFKNNTAGEGEVDQSSTTSDIFGSSSRSMAFGGSFFGRGGGLGVFIDSVGSIPTVSLTIEHSHFIKNKALAIGAGIYAAYFGRNVGHETVINNCTIMENEARDLAGGLLVSFNSYLNTSNVTVQVKNSQFINNRARMAGGAAVFNSYPLGFRTSVSFDHCNFEGNRANKAPALLYASQSRLLESQAMNWKIQNWLELPNNIFYRLLN